MSQMLLYTWKDVERKLLLSKDRWEDVIVDFEIYTNEVIVHINEKKTEEVVSDLLNEILDKRYDNERKRILLDLSDEFLDVSFEIVESVKKQMLQRRFSGMYYIGNLRTMVN